MSQPIDVAYVDVRPELERFPALLARRLNTALGQAQRNVDDQLKETATRAGTRGEEAGEQFGTGFTRGADGRLRDARGRFVAEGRAGGDAFGGGFIGGFGVRLGGLRTALAAATKGLGLLTAGTAGLAGIAAAIGTGAAALAGLASAAAAAIPIIGALAAAIGSASGALLILPGAIAAVVAVTATLKVGLKGMGDAFKAVASGDASALNEALKGLAPNAAGFVRELDRLKPAFDRMALHVQNVLFENTAGELRTLSSSVLPTVSKGLIGIASVLNGQFRAGLQELSTANSRIQLGAIFDNAKRALAGLTVAVKPLIRALLDVGAVSSGMLAGLTAGLGERIAAFAKRLSVAAKDGSLEAMFRDALQTLVQFGRVAADVGNIIKGIFTAAEASGAGAGLLGFLNRLSVLINSIAGQKALTELFKNLGAVGDALVPILLTVAQALGPISKAVAGIAVVFAPTLNNLVEEFANALLNLVPAVIALRPLVDTLGTALVPLSAILRDLIVGAAPGMNAFLEGLVGGLEALMPVAPIVGQAFGNLLTALAPLLPVIGQALAVALAAAAGAISEISLVLGPLIAQFSQGFAVTLAALLPIILNAAMNVLPIMAEAGIQLAQALAPLVPALTQIAILFAGQLATYLPQFASLAQQLVPVVAQLAAQLGQNLIVVLTALAPHFPALIDAAVQWALAMGQLIVAAAPLIALASQMSAGFAVLVLRSNVLKAAIGLLSFAVTGAAGVLRIVAAVIHALTGPIQAAAGAARQLGDAFRIGATIAIAVVRTIPGAIRSALGNTGSLLYSAGRNVVQGLINGIRSMLGSLGSVASSVAQSIRDRLPFSPAKVGPLSGRGNPYYSGQAISSLLAAGMTSRTGQVAAASDTLARAVTAPLPGTPAGSIATLNRLTAPARPTPPPAVASTSNTATDLTVLAGLFGRELRAALNGAEFRMTDVDRVVSRSVGYAANIAARTGGL